MRSRCVISGSVAPASMSSSTSRSLGVRWVSAAIFPTASTVRVVQELSDCAPCSSVQEGGARPYARYMGAGTYLRRGAWPWPRAEKHGLRDGQLPDFRCQTILGTMLLMGDAPRCPASARRVRLGVRRGAQKVPVPKLSGLPLLTRRSNPCPPPPFLRQGRRGHKMLLPVRFLPVRPFAELFVEHGKTTSRKRPHDTRRSGKCARRDTFGSAPPGKGICR